MGGGGIDFGIIVLTDIEGFQAEIRQSEGGEGSGADIAGIEQG